PYDQNFISFDFTALDYQSPEKVQYAYMLENFNEDWIISDHRRYASFTNLEPGEYVFRVKASNSDGEWSENDGSIPFLIRRPWWENGWAYFFYRLAGTGILLNFRQLTLNKERMKADLKLKKLEAEQLHELDETR